MLAMRCEYATSRDKVATLNDLSFRIDVLKVLLRAGDELNVLDHKRYLARTGELLEIGKMVGGWLKSVR